MNIKVYHILAELLSEHTSELQEALDLSQKAITNEPLWGKAYNTKGQILVKLKRFKDARKVFMRAVELDNELAVARSNLGDVYRELGEPDHAEKYFRQALSLEGNHTLTMFRLAGLAIDGSRHVTMLEAE